MKRIGKHLYKEVEETQATASLGQRIIGEEVRRVQDFKLDKRMEGFSLVVGTEFHLLGLIMQVK